MGLWLDGLVTALFPSELEKQMKIENLFVTWQQRSAQSNMPISVSAAWAGGGLGLLTPPAEGSTAALSRLYSGDGARQWISGLCLNVWGSRALNHSWAWGLTAQHWKGCKAGDSPSYLHLSSIGVSWTVCSQAWCGACAVTMLLSCRAAGRPGDSEAILPPGSLLCHPLAL